MGGGWRMANGAALLEFRLQPGGGSLACEPPEGGTPTLGWVRSAVVWVSSRAGASLDLAPEAGDGREGSEGGGLKALNESGGR